MSDLPGSWTTAPISDLGSWVGGGTPSKSNSAYWGGHIPWISPKDMKVEVIRRTIDGITDAAVANSATKIIPPGSVVCVTRSGILAHTLPVAITAVDSTLNQDLKALVPHDEVLPEFIAWALRSNQRDILNTCSKDGTTVHSIEMPSLAAYQLPLPPTNEQRRIVAKIEELFSELDKGVESLRLAREQLKLYRQSVLKHAFEGKLTADWREANPDKLEPPEALLARIEEERDARYRQQLDDWNDAVAAWRADGEVGKKPRKPKRPPDIDEIKADELEKLPALPEGWTYTRFGLFLDAIEAGKSFKCDESEPLGDQVGVAKVSALSWGEYDESESKTCVDESMINPDFFIQSGDFLLSRANTIELVGAVVIVKATTRNIMLSDKTLRLVTGDTNEQFFLHFMRSQLGRAEIERRSTGNQESMRNIGQDRVRAIIVPACSRSEMDEIVERLTMDFDRIDQMERAVDLEIERCSALRQSILKQAFSGQLVPQDPSDEPASALLERIKASQAAKPKPKRRRMARAC